jgi:hypothetical protein
MKNLIEKEPVKQILILKETIRLVRLKTTYWDEEDFLILTDLTDDEIKDIVTPIVEKERKEEQDEEYFYDNEGLVWALKDYYPNNLIDFYTMENIDIITI